MLAIHAGGRRGQKPLEESQIQLPANRQVRYHTTRRRGCAVDGDTGLLSILQPRWSAGMNATMLGRLAVTFAVLGMVPGLAAADDAAVCAKETGEDAITACTRRIESG